jgi:outer membrane protein
LAIAGKSANALLSAALFYGFADRVQELEYGPRGRQGRLMIIPLTPAPDAKRRAAHLRRGAAAVAIAAAFALVSAAAYADTLEDAIARALSGDPALASARTDVDQARAARHGSFSQFLPNVNGSVGYSQNWRGATRIDTNNDGIPDTTVPSITTDASSAGVGVSETVFAGGRLLANYSAAKADEERALATYRAQENGVILTVVQAFAGTLYGEQAVQIGRDQVDRLQREVDAAKTRFEVGAATKTDVYQAQALLAAAQSDLAAAQAALASERATYARRVGELPGTLERTPPPATPPDLDTAVAAARQNAPAIDAADAAVKGARARTRSAYAGYLPSLTLSGSASRTGGANFDNFDNDSSTVSAQLSIPLWTGGRTTAATEQAKAAERGAKYSFDDALRASQETVSQDWALLQAARYRVESGKAQLEAAQFAAKGAALERQEGLRTELDLLAQIAAENTAALALAAAERDVLTATYTLLASIGEIPRPANAPEPKSQREIMPKTKPATAAKPTGAAPAPPAPMTAPTPRTP